MRRLRPSARACTTPLLKMTHMKPLRWLLLLPLTLATSCALQSGSGDASWLFVVHAAEATLTGDTLALSEVSPQVIAFTDRPARKFWQHLHGGPGEGLGGRQRLLRKRSTQRHSQRHLHG